MYLVNHANSENCKNVNNAKFRALVVLFAEERYIEAEIK